MRRWILSLPLLLALLPACGSEMMENDVWDGATTDADIVTVAFRDQLLVVHTGDRYTLIDRHDGAVLADRVSASELDEMAPEVAAFYREMAAGTVVIDASVDPALFDSGPVLD